MNYVVRDGALLVRTHFLGSQEAFLQSRNTNDKSKNSPPRKSKKKTNLTIDLLYLGISALGTQVFDMQTPNFAGSSNLNSIPGSGPVTES